MVLSGESYLTFYGRGGAQRMQTAECIPDGHITFARLALALAHDYESIYVLNFRTGSYVEYRADSAEKELSVHAAGTDFFTDFQRDCTNMVHPEDQPKMKRLFSREYIGKDLGGGKSFSVHYRLMREGRPLFYCLKSIRGTGSDEHYIIIGVQNVDEQRRRESAAMAEYEIYSEITRALSHRYEVIYYVDLRTGSYSEFSSSEKYARLGVGVKGSDFFSDAQRNVISDIDPEDVDMMLEAFSREGFIAELRESGSVSLNYRLILDGRPQYVTLFAIPAERDPDHVIIAVANVDTAVRREMKIRAELGTVRDMASRDALTGVRNKHAYALAEKELNRLIEAKESPPFAVAVCDINGLKAVNDTQGHIAGDDFICAASKLVGRAFPGSPVYRIGGDEFAVLIRDEQYAGCEGQLEKLYAEVRAHRRQGLVTVAAGLSLYDPARDRSVQDVFERADSAMYENKKKFRGTGKTAHE